MSGEGEHDSRGSRPVEPFFSGGGGDPGASCGGPDVGPGAQVGLFKLLDALGEGGYGIVYLAEQERPIRRRVALKIVKPGMDSRQIIARFEAERQALAYLDHPNIAHIYDAGTTPGGRPYFAMEYIEGIPLTAYCDQERLHIRQRLQLFLQVCSAVQHAHQKGIVHRDLKPSNILVATKEENPRIKVIDFGIAKALAQTLTDRTLHTEQGQFIGTPDYMSPEQAEMDAHGVDTRSDVYSLGVVLYELLTGVLPFDPDALRAGGVEHMHAVIRDQEPRTPSTRLTTLGASLADVAKRRRTDAHTLAKTLRRELEWIPLKAMRKEVTRRYQSVADLAGDIDDYLQGKPLLAGPESIPYRSRKFIRRHCVPLAAGLAILSAIVLGLIVSTTMYFRAENARAEAETRLADLYEYQGCTYLASAEYDKALVFLSEAYKIDGTRLSVRMSLLEGLRKHGDPNLRQANPLTRWQSIETDDDLPVSVSPSRTLAAFVDAASGLIYVQRTDTGKQLCRLRASNVLNLAFTSDDRRLIAKIRTDQAHHTIRVFDVQKAEEVVSIERREVDIGRAVQLAGEFPPGRTQLESTYHGLLISPTSEWFAFVDVPGAIEDPGTRVCVWDFAAHVLHTEQEEFRGQFIIGIGYRPPGAHGSGDALLVVDRERVAHVFAVPSMEFGFRYPFGITSVVFSPDGTRYMTFGQQSGVELTDRSSNRPIRRLSGTDRYGFSPDGRYAITERANAGDSESDGVSVRIDVWDARDGRHLSGLRCAEIEDIRFTPDSRYMVTEHKTRQIMVWSLKDFVCTFEIQPARTSGALM
jgi:serine/threonine protein kinase